MQRFLEKQWGEHIEIRKHFTEHNCQNIDVVSKATTESAQELTKSLAKEFAGRLETLGTMVASLETGVAALEQVGDTESPTSVTDVALECDSEANLDIEKTFRGR